MDFLYLNDVSRESAALKDKLMSVFDSTIEHSKFILGKEVELFEKEFASYCNTRHAVGVGSGTSALILPLMALGIGKGDEVITTSMTFVATAAAIAHVGAKPIFVDVQPDTVSINVRAIEEKITDKTKAILPVHLYGIPADMDAIKVLCDKYNLFLIEDCAQAHGAKYKEKKVGSFGDVGCFSFMPSKNLGACGDAGAVVTDSDKLYEKINLLHNHGMKTKYIHECIGFTERLDTLQAAILSVKLKYLEERNSRRLEIANKYNDKFCKAGIRVLQIPDNVKPVYYVYPIFVENREEVKQKLQEDNIETSVHFPLPMHLQPCFALLGYKRGDFPVVEKIAEQLLSIPIHPFLKDEEVEYISNSVIKYAS